MLILFPLATLACLWLLVRFRYRPWVGRSLGVFLFASGGALGWGLMVYWTDPQPMVALAAAPFIFLLAVTLAGHYKLWCILAALAVAALWLWRLGPVRHWRGAVLATGLGCAAALLGMTLETIRSAARIERMAAQMGQTPLDHTQPPGIDPARARDRRPQCPAPRPSPPRGNHVYLELPIGPVCRLRPIKAQAQWGFLEPETVQKPVIVVVAGSATKAIRRSTKAAALSGPPNASARA